MMVGNIFKICILSICLLESGCSTVGAASSGQKDQKTAYDYYVSGNALYSDGRYGEYYEEDTERKAKSPV